MRKIIQSILDFRFSILDCSESKIRNPKSKISMVVSRGKWPPDWWHHRDILFILFPAIFFTSIIPNSWSEQQAQKEKIERKTVMGTLVTLDKRTIYVEYARTEDATYEMMLPVDSQTQFKSVRRLSDLKPGDTVSVEYEQTSRTDENANKVTLGTVAKEVTLIKRAVSGAYVSSEQEGSD